MASTPKFNEKMFLLNLLAQATKEHGDEKRHINSYTFDHGDPAKYKKISELSDTENVLIRKHISQWFIEAEARGFVKENQQHLYQLTDEGYLKAKSYKRPIKLFIKAHIVTSFAAGILLIASLINLLAAIIRSQC